MNGLDQFMIFVSWINTHGEFWIGLSIILMCIPKTRKAGITMLVAMILESCLADFIIKPLELRNRPCFYTDIMEQNNIVLLYDMGVKELSKSFPSGHTGCGIAASLSLFFYHKKAGIAALVFALIVAFSRMYLFLHFPTDVLMGAVIGIISAIISYYVLKAIFKKREASKAKAVEK